MQHYIKNFLSHFHEHLDFFCVCVYLFALYLPGDQFFPNMNHNNVTAKALLCTLPFALVHL